jgi:hypothetical protein
MRWAIPIALLVAVVAVPEVVIGILAVVAFLMVAAGAQVLLMPEETVRMALGLEDKVE